MFDFSSSSQSKSWQYKNDQDLAEIRQSANQLAREGIMESLDQPIPRNANRRSSSLTVAGLKRPRDDSNTAGVEWITAEEERCLLPYFAYMIQDSCGQKSESIKRGLHVQATAITFFKRFFLYNSMLDFDPKIVLMTCMFLAGKVDYEYIKLSELKDVFGEKYGKPIIEFESTLLQGLAFNLKTYHPYNPFFGLVNGLEHVNRVKKLGLTSQKITELVGFGQDTIDRIMPTDLPLLYPPARIALAVLLISANQLGFENQVSQFVSYCFEEEDEYREIMQDVEKITPIIHKELKSTPASLGERKTYRMSAWKEIMNKLKKCARWGSASRQGKKKIKTEG